MFNDSNPTVKVKRTLENPHHIELPLPYKEEVLSRNPMEESQQHEVTKTTEDKNPNGKRTTEKKITGKKARKQSKKRAKL
jgi:hypothetical protein